MTVGRDAPLQPRSSAAFERGTRPGSRTQRLYSVKAQPEPQPAEVNGHLDHVEFRGKVVMRGLQQAVGRKARPFTMAA